MKISAYDVHGRRKYLTIDEGKAFRDKLGALSPKERSFCEFLYYTGCRISEALALTSRDFDIIEKIALIKTLKRRSELITRRVPTPAHLVLELSRDDDVNAGQRLWSFSRTSGWRVVKKAMGNAKITGMHASPKGLRHGLGVRLALANVPINKIQIWMGHSSIETTAIYLDVQGAEEREMMRRTW